MVRSAGQGRYCAPHQVAIDTRSVKRQEIGNVAATTQSQNLLFPAGLERLYGLHVVLSLSGPHDGLEREFKFFNWMEGGVCTTCASEIKRNLSTGNVSRPVAHGTI